MSNKIHFYSDDQICAMRKAGLVVANCLAEFSQLIKPGVTTAQLDLAGREMLAEANAVSNFLGYGTDWGNPFPAVVCTSVNQTVVHGIPGQQVLGEGDLVSVDFGAIVAGWHSDAARTFIVGNACLADQKLVDTTRQAMWAGIAAFWTGKTVSDISSAIEHSVLHNGRYGLVREYTGHGIGQAMHQEPDVPNYRRFGLSPKLRSGMTLAIEPMVTMGSRRIVELDDEWTVVTADGSNAAHWENTVARTANGLWVLSELDGGQSELAKLGIPFAPLAD